MVAMTLMDPKIFENLFTRLGGDPLAPDVAVVWMAAHDDGAGGWSLHYGSVLLGPAEMATSSWLDWRAASGDAYAAQATATLSQQGITTATFADFVLAEDEWLIARTSRTGQG